MNCGLDRTGDVVVDGAAAQNRLDIISGQIVNLDNVLHPVLLSVITLIASQYFLSRSYGKFTC